MVSHRLFECAQQRKRSHTWLSQSFHRCSRPGESTTQEAKRNINCEEKFYSVLVNVHVRLGRVLNQTKTNHWPKFARPCLGRVRSWALCQLSFNNLLPLLQQLHGFRTTFSNRFTFFATESLFYWNRTRNQNNDSRMKQRLNNCWCLCWIVVVSCSITQQLFDARGGLSGSHPVCP